MRQERVKGAVDERVACHAIRRLLAGPVGTRHKGLTALLRMCACVDAPSMDEIDIRQAEMLKTLAHPIRLGIIHQLASGPTGVASLAAQLGISQPNASQHLAVMRASGVVIADRNGREACYRLFDPEIVTACEIMHRVLQRRIEHLAALSSHRRSGVALPFVPASDPTR